jgi:dihydrofolate reductase
VTRLVYSAIASLDGYIADRGGGFGWAAPDEEVHAFVNDLQRPIGTYLYGRRMYQIMSFWEAPALDGASAAEKEYAGIWQAADKVVYSSTLSAVSTGRTRLEHRFDPEAVRRQKRRAEADLGIGGSGLASQVLAAGLVDELQLFLTPVLVGGGTPFLASEVRIDLDLVEERRFAGGVVYLRYTLRS